MDHPVAGRRAASLAPLLVIGVTLTAGCASATTHTSAPVARPAAHTTTAARPTAGAPTTTVARTTTTSPAGATTPPTAKPPARPLARKTIGIDPGHNGGNGGDPAFINHLIWNGRELETCDTTGTATDGGYSEARFNFRVARDLVADLRAAGARVVLTRTTNDGVGPCVTTRARILDRAHASVAIDIHADGGPPGGRGFTVLEPVADGPNDRVIAASKAFGRDLLRQYRRITGMPESTYDGTNGIAYRDDLAGLNLTTVPKVLIECGNMRNATDAARLVDPAFQRLAARAFAVAITQFVTRR